MTTGGRLFVSDIDGTLVTPDKQLTVAAVQAVADVRAAGVPFSVVSSRPPRGMRGIVDALDVALPFAAFNGGNLVAASGELLAAHRLAAEAARQALQIIERAGVLPWVFADDAWLVKDVNGPKVERERGTVHFDPTVVAGFDVVIERIDKIVVPSDDHALLDRVEADLRTAVGGDANVERSQAYYIDITHPLANKGEAVRAIAAHVGADLARTVVIGDMSNDIAMFRVAGFAIAMGQSPDAVKAQAGAVTAANTDDGFAKAVASLVLPRLGMGPAEAPSSEALVLVVMGVSGAGKTTIAKALAERLGWTFKEGDDLHPQANIAKMKAGHPLTDADREPWLDAIAAWIDAELSEGRSGVITCSALKRAYRDRLDRGRPQLRFVFVKLSEAATAERVAARKGHFMPPSLLESQFADLEPPTSDEPVIVADATLPIETQVGAVVRRLGLEPPV